MKNSFKVKVLKPNNYGALEITSLVFGPDGNVYGGVTGHKHHLFFKFDPSKEKFTDLGSPAHSEVDIHTGKTGIVTQKIHHSLVVDSTNGIVYGGTGRNISVMSPWFRFDDEDGGRLFSYNVYTGKSKDLGIALPKQWIFCLTASFDFKYLYCLTAPLNNLVSYEISTGRKKVLGQIHGVIRGDSVASHEIICDEKGNLYGSCRNGVLFKYDIKKEKIFETDIKLPGNDLRIDSLTRHDNGLIYGGTWESGYLFSFNPVKGKIRLIGKPNLKGTRLPALRVSPVNGKIYGAAGGGDTYDKVGAMFFEYDPKKDKIRNFGNVEIKDKKIKAARIHALTIGNDNTVYLGETGSGRAKQAERTGVNPYLYICNVFV